MEHDNRDYITYGLWTAGVIACVAGPWWYVTNRAKHIVAEHEKKGVMQESANRFETLPQSTPVVKKPTSITR